MTRLSLYAILTVALLCLSAPALVVAQEDLSRAATPDKLGEWAAQISNNYPAEALRNEWQGSVGVAVIINEQGRVAGCAVTRSSGHSVLDQAACDGMRKFALFNPARDRRGNPTKGSFSTSITYRLNSGESVYPAVAEPVEMDQWVSQIVMDYPSEALRNEWQGKVGVIVLIFSKGKVIQCYVAESSGHDVLDKAACDGMMKYARFKPVTETEGDFPLGAYATTITYSID